jgi:hypothetical protein
MYLCFNKRNLSWKIPSNKCPKFTISSALTYSDQKWSPKITTQSQKLAVLLAKGNVALLLNRIQTFPNPDIDGVQL